MIQKPFYESYDGEIVFWGITQDNGKDFIRHLRLKYPELGLPSRLLIKGHYNVTDSGLKVSIYKQNKTRWILSLKDNKKSNEELINEICDESYKFYSAIIEKLEKENEARFNKMPSDFLEIIKIVSSGLLTPADYVSYYNGQCEMHWTDEQLPNMKKQLESHGYIVKQDGVTVNLIIIKNYSKYKFATHTYDNRFWLTKIS